MRAYLSNENEFATTAVDLKRLCDGCKLLLPSQQMQIDGNKPTTTTTTAATPVTARGNDNAVGLVGLGVEFAHVLPVNSVGGARRTVQVLLHLMLLLMLLHLMLLLLLMLLHLLSLMSIIRLCSTCTFIVVVVQLS